jgi:starch phosphorylase
VLVDTPASVIEERSGALKLPERVEKAVGRLREYVSAAETWAGPVAGPLHVRPVCYFSAEFGLHESLPLYSGGLGLLSGDHLKSSSELGIPLVGIGLFYGQGYFSQALDASGRQREEYPKNAYDRLPITRAKDKNGKPFTVKVETPSGDILAAVWKLQVGRVPLFLLDTDVEGNAPSDRELTARLYGGDRRVRIRQEMLLGIGGLRALDAMGIMPGVLHLNEGHCAFAPLELIRRFMHENAVNFDTAWREVRRMTVFTTHTPVEAGHDRFTPQMMEANMGSLRRAVGLDEWSLLALGRVDANDDGEQFCMTVLALKCSSRANGVSALHGHVSRKMWQSLYNHLRFENEIPIGHITNGVHMPSYVAPEMGRLLAKAVDENWAEHLTEPAVWAKAESIDFKELWAVRNRGREKLVEFARRRLVAQSQKRNDPKDIEKVGAESLRPDVFTIGFARRFATYKRAKMMFRDPDRLAKLLGNPSRPVQIIFAGKAHPMDEPGKSLIQDIFQMTRDPRFQRKVVFIENYDINVGRHMYQGIDLWLNNPLRPLEACGTSGQKVILNGGLNLSTLDGWWAEAYDGRNGFPIGDIRVHSDYATQEKRDSDSLYDQLENHVIPLFYGRDSAGVPVEWLKRVRHSMRTLTPRFSSDRMLMDYMNKLYVPAATATTASDFDSQLV